LYLEDIGWWFDSEVRENWVERRGQVMLLLQEESELEEIVQLVGVDALSPQDRLKLEAARSIREDFLQQDAFNSTDSYTEPDKQYDILSLVLEFYNKAKTALDGGVAINDLVKLPVRELIGRFKYVAGDETKAAYEHICDRLSLEINELKNKLTEGDA
jgi:V/A-type H+-transporting ATPase subunit A